MSGSIAWKFFTRQNGNNVVCNLCGKSYKTSGNTTNLVTHLKNKHEHAYNEIKKVKTGKDLNMNSTDIEFLENNDEVNSSATNAKKINKTQLSLPSLMERTASFEDGGHKHLQITQALVYMVCLDNYPFSCVEKQGLKKFMQATCSRYKLPSRSKLTELVSRRYLSTKELVKIDLETMKDISFTSDIVTLTNSTRSFLIITAHFIGESKDCLEKICLAAEPLAEAHTGVYIAGIYEKVFKDYNIKKPQAVCFTTDGGSNMICAVNIFLGENHRVPCMAHLINLIVDEALKNNLNFSRLANKVKSIVSYFKHSVSASDALRAEQVSAGKTEGQVLMLIQSVNTRWNSLFDMLQRFLSLSALIAKILALRSLTSNTPDMVSTPEIKILRDFVRLLQPFKEVTEEISGENYVTASLVIPLSNLISLETEQCSPATSEGIAVKRELLHGVEKRLNPLEKNLFLAKATILDPRFKKIYFKSALAVSDTILQISKEINSKINCKEPRVSTKLAISPIKSINNSPSLWDRHEKLVMSNSTERIRNTNELPTEFKQYLNEPNQSRSSNPLSFWQAKKCLTPILFQISQKYMVICASSVSSERVASTINLVVPDNRSRLSGEHINQRVFLKTVSQKYWE